MNTTMKKRCLQAALLLFLLTGAAYSPKYTPKQESPCPEETAKTAPAVPEELAPETDAEPENKPEAETPTEPETAPETLPARNGWANCHDSRITYEDGCYYYASQADHYYLYRADEDGGNPQCLAKAHADNICVQDDTVYFVNQSDGYGVYRVRTDGTGMEKLCQKGYHLQAGGEYLFFQDAYDPAYDPLGLVTAAESAELSEDDTRFLYRMKKDGSERELLVPNLWDYQLENGCLYYSISTDQGQVIYRTDFAAQNQEELCHLAASENIVVCGEEIYGIDKSYENKKSLRLYSLQNGSQQSFGLPSYDDACLFHGYFYGLCEPQTEEGQERTLTIYRIDLNTRKRETLYQNTFRCEGDHHTVSEPVSDLYATEKGVFFRQFVSGQEGCQWFLLSEDGSAHAWEDRDAMPTTLPARSIDSGEMLSVNSVLRSTPGYETYLAEDLTYEESYHVDFEDSELNQTRSWDIPFTVSLPQFNSKIAGYRQINAYFQNAYQEALQDKDAYFKEIREIMEENPSCTSMWYQTTRYHYIYIGERYITVDQHWDGYYGGAHVGYTECPVTFDRETGETVSLEALLDMPLQEAVAALTASVYKYKECIGDGYNSFFLQRYDPLTEEYNPEKFYLFPDGVGIYYEKYAIDCGAAGDQLFVVPYEEFPGVF